jgi:predicted TIM-barrel fold metal-dependent hydrolase
MRFQSAVSTSVLLIAILSLFLFSNDLAASEIYFIDAHSQVDQNVKNLELVIQRMDQGGVYCTILAARRGRKSGEIADFAERHPDRIIPAVRIKGGPYRENKPKYYKKLRKQVASGRFRAMAEVLMYHAQKGDRAPEVIVYPHDQRVQAALEAAIENEWPFVVHIEFSSLKGSHRQRFMGGLEEMLATYPEHPFPLIHMGQLDAAEVRGLIEKHKNMYFLTSHANPVIVRISREPWVNLFKDSTLAPQWKELIIQFPDRFVFALDNVWEKNWTELYLDQMDYWRKAMTDLPADVAKAVAHGNAERLWKIPPRGSK